MARFKILLNGEIITETDSDKVAAVSFSEQADKISVSDVKKPFKNTLEMQDHLANQFARMIVESGKLQVENG